MYQCIVVGTDGSDGADLAIEHGAQLARLTGATLHLVQGCGSPALAAPMYGEVPAIDPREVVEACQAELEPLAIRLRSTGIEVAVHVIASSGQAAVCNVAEAVDADLVVVGNRGMTGARRLLGSVPNSIAHHAPCTVMIVHP
jgi:nucleotide-binding universal stress UspA family protein